MLAIISGYDHSCSVGTSQVRAHRKPNTKPPYTLPREESLLKDTLILAQGVRSEGHLEGHMNVTLYHP